VPAEEDFDSRIEANRYEPDLSVRLPVSLRPPGDDPIADREGLPRFPQREAWDDFVTNMWRAYRNRG
jgi:hypothetical protein